MKTKEEIQKEIDQIGADKKALQRTIDSLTGDIAGLLKQLAEAEKPKLGHGDFGILDDYGPYMAVGCASDFQVKRNEILLASSGGLTPTPANEEVFLNQWHFFGNIFKIMEGWGEPLGKYEKKCRGGNTLIISRSHIAPSAAIEFRINKNGCYATADIPQAEEIWCKLGHLLMTLKKKLQEGEG